MATRHIGRIEHRQAVIIGKIDQVTVRMHAHAVHVFLHGQAVSNEMTDKLFLLGVILPNAHRRSTPDVTVISLHDIPYHLVGQSVANRETNGLLLAAFVQIQALVGTY